MNNRKTQKQSFQPMGKSIPFDGPEKIQSSCIECFEYEYSHTRSGRDMEITTETDEFTSVCPFSGLPDFARIIISYVPDKKCIELRSLKYYLLSYRNVGIWYEHLVNRMLEDLVNACQPRRMRVEIICTPRGGLASTVVAHYQADSNEK